MGTTLAVPVIAFTEFAIVVAVITAAALLGLIRRAVRRGNMGLGTGIMAATMIYTFPCLYCSKGVQIMLDGTWGPVPVGYRTTSPSPYTDDADENTRVCPVCSGMGSRLQYLPREHNYRPPNMGMIIDNRRRWKRPW